MPYNILSQELNTDSINEVYNYIFNQNKRIYMLGENNHEEKETQKLKSEIIVKALNDNNIDLILWESDFCESLAIYLYRKYNDSSIYNSKDYKIKAIFKIWHSDYIKEVFANLDFDIDSINFMGIDILPGNTLFNDWLHYELKSMNYKDLYKIDSINNLITNWWGEANIDLDQKTYFTNEYNKVKDFINANKSKYTEFEFVLINHALLNRQNLIKFISIPKRFSYNYRDSCMAENIIWMDSLFNNNKKILVWSSNIHLTYNRNFNISTIPTKVKTSVGNLLLKEYKTNINNVCISAPKIKYKKGYVNNNFPKNSFEYLYKGDSFYTVLNLKSTVFAENCNRTMKTMVHYGVKSNLCEEFDQLIIVKKGRY